MTKREFIKGVFQGGLFLWLRSRLPTKASPLRHIFKTLTNHKRRPFIAPKPVRMVGGLSVGVGGSASLIVTKRAGPAGQPPV